MDGHGTYIEVCSSPLSFLSPSVSLIKTHFPFGSVYPMPELDHFCATCHVVNETERSTLLG